MQLNRVLPAGPRDYWNELAAEHSNVPEHMKWMYEADPFAARKAVDERQAKAAQKRGQSSSDTHTDSARGNSVVSGELSTVPEVRMATTLREQVEDAVKQVR